MSDAAFRKWLKQDEQGGLEGLIRADAEFKEVLPEGIDRTEEAYKREILRLRIENNGQKIMPFRWTKLGYRSMSV